MGAGNVAPAPLIRICAWAETQSTAAAAMLTEQRCSPPTVKPIFISFPRVCLNDCPGTRQVSPVLDVPKGNPEFVSSVSKVIHKRFVTLVLQMSECGEADSVKVPLCSKRRDRGHEACNRIVNWVPRPSWLSTVIVPPIRSIISLTIERPR